MARLEDVHQEPLSVDPASTASISYPAFVPTHGAEAKDLVHSESFNAVIWQHASRERSTTRVTLCRPLPANCRAAPGGRKRAHLRA
jgi:hypothetical protein